MTPSKKLSDKERIDWMQSHYAGIKSDKNCAKEKFFVERPQTPYEQSRRPFVCFIGFGWHETLRQAIDAAMKASR